MSDDYGICGYIGCYAGKSCEVYAETSFKAWQQVVSRFNVPEKKQHLVSVHLCERNVGTPERKQVVHVADF